MGVRSARISQQRHCNAHCSVHVTERLWRSAQHSVPPAVPGTADMLCCECLRDLTELLSCKSSSIRILLLCSLLATLSRPVTQACYQPFSSHFLFLTLEIHSRDHAVQDKVQCSSKFSCLHTAGMYSATAWQQAVFLCQVGTLNRSATIIAYIFKKTNISCFFKI